MKLKGKTIIELTNVNTGEVEHYEDENIVTNVFQKMFEPIGIFGKELLFSVDIPYYHYLTGGVLLFDTTIEENKNNLYAPAGVSLTGCGVYNQTNLTDNTCRGNYNTNESSEDAQNGIIKYVYDFPTDKGNGTIQCVCLTSSKGGYCGYGAENTTFLSSSKNFLGYNLTNNLEDFLIDPNITFNSGSVTINKTESAFLADIDNGILYTFKIDTLKQITILKHNLMTTSTSFFEDPYDTNTEVAKGGRILETKTITLTNGMQGNTYFSYNVDLKNDKLYIFSSTKSIVKSGGDTTSFNVITINTDTLELIEDKNYTNNTTASLTISYCAIQEGHLYSCSTDGIYKFDSLDNLSNNHLISISKKDTKSYSPVLSFYINGKFYTDVIRGNNYSSNFACIIDTQTLKATTTEYQRFLITDVAYPSGIIPVKGRSWLYLVIDEKTSYGGINRNAVHFKMPGNYLATINNLAQPITKTAEKTMKLTYILQKAEEE